MRDLLRRALHLRYPVAGLELAAVFKALQRGPPLRQDATSQAKTLFLRHLGRMEYGTAFSDGFNPKGDPDQRRDHLNVEPGRVRVLPRCRWSPSRPAPRRIIP